MKRSRRHNEESAIYAALIAAGFVVVTVVSQLTGYRKHGGPAKPKTVLEVLHDSPMLVALGMLVFIAAWWWQTMKKETLYVICRNCQEPFDAGDVPDGRCLKCHGPLEDLEGFYERHPELGAQKKKPEYETCKECGKTSWECRDFVCPDCRSVR